jgi:hypothetical protein
VPHGAHSGFPAAFRQNPIDTPRSRAQPGPLTDPDETKSIDTVISALEAPFPSFLRPEIEKVVGQRYHGFDGAP